MELGESTVVHTDADTDAAVPAAAVPATELDLDMIETDLADVELALTRLELGTYWTCEVSGQPLPDDLLEAKPTARRLADH